MRQRLSRHQNPSQRQLYPSPHHNAQRLPQRLLKKAFLAGSKACLEAQKRSQQLQRPHLRASLEKPLLTPGAMAVVSAQSAVASAVAVMAAVVAVAAIQQRAALAAKPDLTCALSALANAQLSHVQRVVQRVVRKDDLIAAQMVEPTNAASARMVNAVNVAMPHAPTAHAQNAQNAQNAKSALSARQAKCVNPASHASHAKVAAPSARAQGVVSAPSVAASAHRATLLSKKWRWPTRLPWPLLVVIQVHRPKTARSKMAVKAAPAVAVAATTAVASAAMKARQHLWAKCQAAT